MSRNINDIYNYDSNSQSYDLLVVQIKSDLNNNYVQIGWNNFFYATASSYLDGKILSFILLPKNQLRSSMMLTEQLLLPLRLSIRSLRRAL